MPTLIFTINALEFWIDEFSDGFGWYDTVSREEGELFATAHEAQKDAIRFYSERELARRDEPSQAADDAKHGTYEEQAAAHWKASRI